MIGFDQNLSTLQIYKDIRTALGNPANPSLAVPSRVAQNLNELWNSFQDKTLIYPRLQYWYTRRAAMDMVLGGQWQLFDWEEDGVSQKTSQNFSQLHGLRDDADGEIKTLLLQAQASRSPAVGQLAAQNPGPQVPCGLPNPNNPRYRGSPLFRDGWNRY